jgi:glutathione synthase/RimK-type ligase-like ATP-grasp enzyme
MDALRTPFKRQDMTLTEVCWDSMDVSWRSFDAVIIGTTWDYWDRSDLFLDTLDSIESETLLLNPSSIVKWNSDKRYLEDMGNNGAELIPTKWIDDPVESEVVAAFDALDCNDMVLKRQVGAGAAGQYRLKRGDAIPKLDRPMMAQAFLPSIQTEGEMSYIFIDGAFSHALIKRAKDGDYRIQSSYGGTEQAISPSEDDLDSAKRVVSSLESTPLYARVDMLRSENGSLYLMELELIEPYLYPIEGPELGPRMAEAVNRRLAES